MQQASIVIDRSQELKFSESNPQAAETKGHVLPIYFVVDESRSMEPDMETLNEGMMSFLDELHGNPMATSKVRFSVIGFSKKAYVYLKPSDMRSIEAMPLLEARSMTNYGAVFHLLRERTETDAMNLAAEGYKVFRPTVFFLTDGAPSDKDWRDAYEHLVNPEYAFRPNILAFGFGGANHDIIREIATQPVFAFQAEDNVGTAEALQEFMASLTKSVIQSGMGAARGKVKLELDEAPAGFISLALDEVADMSNTDTGRYGADTSRYGPDTSRYG